ncbi:MAG: SRPBCC family protein [Candidatus Hydrogenedentes bacterium]|nr:SRPBCC family protein [Candidatus Hydrogenedentota bacterium]
MGRKLGIAFSILAALVAVFCVVVALQPADFRIERSASIDAPPENVFALVNNFRHWDRWSPWARRDPEMTAAYEGPEAGAGAVYAWAGNNEVGEGRMTITESIPHARIEIQLDFFRPFAATNTAVFTFAESGGATSVTWSMEGRNNFLAKAFNLLMDMDAMVGGDFEKGLAAMKSAAETSNTGESAP